MVEVIKGEGTLSFVIGLRKVEEFKALYEEIDCCDDEILEQIQDKLSWRGYSLHEHISNMLDIVKDSLVVDYSDVFVEFYEDLVSIDICLNSTEEEQFECESFYEMCDDVIEMLEDAVGAWTINIKTCAILN